MCHRLSLALRNVVGRPIASHPVSPPCRIAPHHGANAQKRCPNRCNHHRATEEPRNRALFSRLYALLGHFAIQVHVGRPCLLCSHRLLLRIYTEFLFQLLSLLGVLRMRCMLLHGHQLFLFSFMINRRRLHCFLPFAAFLRPCFWVIKDLGLLRRVFEEVALLNLFLHMLLMCDSKLVPALFNRFQAYMPSVRRAKAGRLIVSAATRVVACVGHHTFRCRLSDVAIGSQHELFDGVVTGRTLRHQHRQQPFSCACGRERCRNDFKIVRGANPF